MLNTYVINLKESADRKEYIVNLFGKWKDYFNLNFVEAVDGRHLSDKALYSMFNQELAYVNYGRYLKGGEVGCALSHRKCYENLLNSNENVALVVEDDLVWQGKEVDSIVREIVHFMTIDRPIVILLSGDYWFTSIKKISQEVKIARVREAVCSHAYLINRSAAKMMLMNEKCYLADDWYSLTKCGIGLYGLYPHIADQNRKDWDTKISTDYTGLVRKNLSLKGKLFSYYRGAIKHLLYYIGHFEFKDFIQK